MALNASIKTRFWTISNYQKVLTSNIDHVAYRVEIRIGLYDSQSAAEEGMLPLEERNISVQFTPNPPEITEEQQLMYAWVPHQAITPELIDLLKSIASACYGFAKLHPEFKESKNV